MTGLVIRKHLLFLLFILLFPTTVFADLPNPATLTIKENEPSQFTVTFTLPVIDGRMLSMTPVLPDICIVNPEPVLMGDAGKAIRIWEMTCDPDLLIGQTIGMDGLLGTTMNVLMTIETLNKQKYTVQLRPTSAYYVIPPGPTFVQLLRTAGFAGFRRTSEYPVLLIFLLVLTLSGVTRRDLILSLIVFSLSHGIGQWLGMQKVLTVSVFLPHIAVAGFTWLIGLRQLGNPLLRNRWWQPASILMILLGFFFGAAQPGTVDLPGMSDTEKFLSLFLFSVGILTFLFLTLLTSGQLKRTIAGFTELNRIRWEIRIIHISMIISGGLFLYRISTPFFSGTIGPEVSVINLASAIALGLLWRQQKHPDIRILSVIAGGVYVAGIMSGFVVEPLLSGSFSLLLPAILGVLLFSGYQEKGWIIASLTGLLCFFQGSILPQTDGRDFLQSVEYVLGSGIVTAGTLYLVYKMVPDIFTRRHKVSRIAGLLLAALSILLRLTDYRDWINRRVGPELALGRFPIPVAAIAILLVVAISWPRRRRFDQKTHDSVLKIPYLLLMGALFIVPSGTVTLDIPFHTADVPSAAEAGKVLNILLTDIYSAFNLTDEEAAFDRLAENISKELVPDVYLDSRRRLKSGTRQGAEVTVKEVQIVAIDDVVSNTQTSFTYPCSWVVTARVRHLQHVHDRQNLYIGEVTIIIEESKWKISELNLHDEEQEVLSRRRL